MIQSWRGKGKHVVAVTAVWLTGASGIAYADVTVSVNNPGSFTQHAIAVRPGDTFSVDVTVSTDVEIFDVFDMKLLAGQAGVLTVTGGSFQDPWTSSSAPPVGELNPQSARFDAAIPFPELFGPGESVLFTLNLAVNGNASPGVFSLNVIDGKVTACRICPAFSSAESGPDFIVQVVGEEDLPAVSQWGMVVMVLLMLTVGTILWPRCRAAGCRVAMRGPIR